MDRHSDVFVIGGGIIGLASAYYLAKEDKRVRLVEQDSIGAGASYGNCGLIFTSHLIPLCVPGTIRQEIKRMFRRTSPLCVSLAPDIKRFMWFLSFASKCNPLDFKPDIWPTPFGPGKKFCKIPNRCLRPCPGRNSLNVIGKKRVSCWYLKPKRKCRNMFKPMTGCEPHIDPTASGVNRF